MFHGGGDGRTYSGVWPGGQVARKPLFFAILQARSTAGAMSKGPGIPQRFLKPDGVRLAARGIDQHVLAYQQEARDAQISAPIRMDHVRGRLRGAALRGAGYVDLGREDHD